MNMKTAIRTANRIWSRYCRNAVRLPMGISRLSTRIAPNHMTATVERLRITVITGIVTAKSRLTLREVSYRSRLDSSKRCSSCFVRTKARMTRTPASVSRMTWLMRSSLAWTARNSGIARDMTRAMKAAINGSTTMSRPDNGTSWRMARMIPPMIRIGAEMMSVRAMKTTIWTCWTSLVLRVISDGVPKRLISTWLKSWTLRKMAPRTSRPKPIAVIAPQYTPTIDARPTTTVTASMNAPVEMM